MNVQELHDTVHMILRLPCIAGFAGALISVMWHKPSVGMSFMYIAAGVLAALFGTEPVMHWQQLAEPWGPFTALLLGAFSGTAFSMVFTFIHSGKPLEVLSDILDRFVKGDKK